ncbi:hypothetical protein JKP88DRAFT_337581 [Tribonema minus]|uniref:Transmembrane protein n=1 Tax=Tribonema minus TaxID=303371 RepID=A0A835YSL9_9STRA|nr:hypothetical protein JKP88DRAFT_337581 [Tribonema minus]
MPVHDGAYVNLDLSSSVLPIITAIVLANLVTLAMLGILYSNYLLFADYFFTILWAVLISEALQSAKGVVLWGIEEISCPERRPNTSMIVAAAQVMSEGLRAQPAKLTPPTTPLMAKPPPPQQHHLSPRPVPPTPTAATGGVGGGAAGGGTALGVRALVGLSVFSGASFLSLLTHLTPWWLLLGGLLAALVPALLLAYVLDRCAARSNSSKFIFFTRVFCQFNLKFTHLTPWWLLLGGLLAALVLLAYVLGRRVFFYRRFISDNTVATLVVIGVFFLCSGFIVLFLGTESVLEGLTVAERATKWITSVMDNREVKEALSEHILKGEHALRDALAGMEATYNGTLWWGPARDALNGTLWWTNRDAVTEFMEGSGGGGAYAVGEGPGGAGMYALQQGAGEGGEGACTVGGWGGAAAAGGEQWGGQAVVSQALSQLLGGVELESLTPWQVAQKLRDQLASWEISPGDVLMAMGHARWGGQKMANISLKVVQGLLVVLAFLLSVGFKTILFFSVLWYVLSQESLIERMVRDLLPISPDKKVDAVRTLRQESLIERMVRDLLPISPDKKVDAVRTLRQSIEGVFFSIPTIACFHGIITLASFTALSIEFPFFSTFLSVIFSLLPVVDPYLVCLPWVAALIIGGDLARGVALFVLQYVVSSFVAKRIINTGVSRFNGFLTYLTVLSIFMGFAVFGVQGVFAGPLVLVLGRLVFLSLDSMASSSEASWPELIMRYPSMRNLHSGRTRSMGNIDDS